MGNAHVPATAKGRATRERILQAAAVLLAEKGGAGMSLDDVRARTGASRSQLYHYFDDRDDLVHAVIDVTADAVLGRQGELLDHLDSWAGIDRWFDFMVQHQIEQQARGGCPIGSLAGQLAESDPAARAAIAAGLERWEAHLRDGHRPLFRLRGPAPDGAARARRSPDRPPPRPPPRERPPPPTSDPRSSQTRGSAPPRRPPPHKTPRQAAQRRRPRRARHCHH